jgi:YVTN family beta-propeller protein
MRNIRRAFLFAVVVAALVGSTWLEKSSRGDAAHRLSPTNSSPIAISHDDRFVWTVNPDNDSVSVLEVGGDVNTKIAEIQVGDEPRCVAITPNDRKVFVTNMASGTVSVIDALARQVIRTIQVGAEPFGCAITPNGTKLYVANSSSDSVSVINTSSERVIKTIENVGSKPRGIAITAEHRGNGNNKVYVTQFLAQLQDDARPVVEKEGRDDGKEGRVTVISAASDKVIGTTALDPLADTGFKSNGRTLDPPVIFDSLDATTQRATGAFPNLLQSIVIKGDRAYLPNTASSPNGPFRFNVNVQGFLSVMDTGLDVDSGQTINMNKGVQFESATTRLFITNPIAVAFKRNSNEGFVVSAATNRLVRVALDAAGTPTINAPTSAIDPGSIVRIEVGKNPQGIVFNSNDTRAYVMNRISRDVSVVNIGSASPSEITRIAAASLPLSGTQEAIILRGHELFNTGIGPAGTVPESTPPAGRMSNFGWGSCYGCHPDGLTDGVTWMFPDGPRQTVSMESTFAHPQPAGATLNANGAPLLPSSHQRILNWSAVRDEVQDFELNIRAVSGGQGLITDGLAVVNLTPTANTGRSAELDTIAAYIAFGIRAPVSPLRGQDVSEGRSLFSAANCQSCHGGADWTRSRVDFTPPPGALEPITGGQLTRFLFPVGTFDSTAFNEFKAQGTAQTAIVAANGALGFNVPSLLSVFAGAPYLHSGLARTLEEVLENVTHRSAGTGGVDTLSSISDRQALARFLKSIDAQTPPFP